LSAGAPTQTSLGELTALPRPPSWILGGLLLRGKGRDERRREEGEGREGEEKGKEGRDGGGEGGGRVAPKLKLAPQNYFPGAGAGEWALLTRFSRSEIKGQGHHRTECYRAEAYISTMWR